MIIFGQRYEEKMKEQRAMMKDAITLPIMRVLQREGVMQHSPTLFSLFTFHFSLFTFHLSPFTSTKKNRGM